MTVWGFSAEQIKHFPNGESVECSLNNEHQEISFPEARTRGTTKWNRKPEVNSKVFKLSKTMNLGFSRAHVCYRIDSQVVGMLTAKDDNAGYVIPIERIYKAGF